MEARTLVLRISDIFTQVNRLLAIANDEVAPGLQRFGGYLTVLNAKDGKILLVLACGTIPEDGMEKCFHFSLEKANRLFQTKEHKTSWDSRNEVNSQYPGAVKGVEAIYSFSCHQPDVDEAISTPCNQPDVDEAISTSVFYMMEPSKDNLCRDPKETQDLFNFYFQEVAERNRFIKPFIKATDSFYGNFFLKGLIR